jgi:glycosyltransferase involved in cell wall biosynthesis
VNVVAANALETGYVTDAQLRALYERAACFVYPSIYEGFGIPPLEGMTCGCPVLVSRAASLPEICGTGAAYCDPHDPDDIARQLYLLLSSKSARDDLRAAGLARAREWTWAKAARRLDEIVGNSVI